MKYLLGVIVAGVVWLPCTVVGWGVGTSMSSGTQYALVATAIPLGALAIIYVTARALKWREFANAFAITAAILVTICGICNFSSIENGNRPPRIGGEKFEQPAVRPA